MTGQGTKGKNIGINSTRALQGWKHFFDSTYHMGEGGDGGRGGGDPKKCTKTVQFILAQKEFRLAWASEKRYNLHLHNVFTGNIYLFY